MIIVPPSSEGRATEFFPVQEACSRGIILNRTSHSISSWDWKQTREITTKINQLRTSESFAILFITHTQFAAQKPIAMSRL